MTSDTTVRTTLDCLLQHDRERGQQTYLVQPYQGEIRQWTWSKVKCDAEAIANGLKAQGIQPGDRIAIWSKNCAEWIIADFAISLAGAISVPIYPGQSKGSVHFVLDHSDSKLIILGKQDNDQDIDDALTGVTIKRLALRYFSGQTDLHWQDVLRQHQGQPFTAHPVNADDLATIVYTSGTTGNPKGVMHTYRSIANTCETFRRVFQTSDRHRFFSYLP